MVFATLICALWVCAGSAIRCVCVLVRLLDFYMTIANALLCLPVYLHTTKIRRKKQTKLTKNRPVLFALYVLSRIARLLSSRLYFMWPTGYQIIFFFLPLAPSFRPLCCAHIIFGKRFLSVGSFYLSFARTTVCVCSIFFSFRTSVEEQRRLRLWASKKMVEKKNVKSF